MDMITLGGERTRRDVLIGVGVAAAIIAATAIPAIMPEEPPFPADGWNEPTPSPDQPMTVEAVAGAADALRAAGYERVLSFAADQVRVSGTVAEPTQDRWMRDFYRGPDGSLRLSEPQRHDLGSGASLDDVVAVADLGLTLAADRPGIATSLGLIYVDGDDGRLGVQIDLVDGERRYVVEYDQYGAQLHFDEVGPVQE